MGTPFLGEIKIISWNFPPKGWAFCGGQQLPINQNQALFSILGTMYGGNGQTTFALPDFRGRAPIHQGAGFTVGQAGGQEFHTVTQSEMPAHIHIANGTSNTADLPAPGTNLLAKVDLTALTTNLYAPAANFTAMAPASVANAGGFQPHENRQPYLVLNMIIALQGVFPSQT